MFNFKLNGKFSVWARVMIMLKFGICSSLALTLIIAIANLTLSLMLQYPFPRNKAII